MPAVAVIADAHFHDIEGDYDFAGVCLNGRRLTVRSWADTAGSTRVFNESFAALPAALDRVSAMGIRHVVLLGDYTDDGQRETTESLARLLRRYRSRNGPVLLCHTRKSRRLRPGRKTPGHPLCRRLGRHHARDERCREGGVRSRPTDRHPKNVLRRHARGPAGDAGLRLFPAAPATSIGKPRSARATTPTCVSTISALPTA